MAASSSVNDPGPLASELFAPPPGESAGEPAYQPTAPSYSPLAGEAMGYAQPAMAPGADAGPGRWQAGHYTITVTETGSNTSSSFTLVETAVVDYSLSIDPSQSYTWDDTVALDYVFQMAGGTSAQGASFTSHAEGDVSTFQPDGGVWGGFGNSNAANPYSFGLFNYNAAGFPINGNWTQFTWDETGEGSNVLVDNESPSTTVTAGTQTTASNETSHESDLFSTSFTYHLAGSNGQGQVSVAAYSSTVQDHDEDTFDAGGTIAVSGGDAETDVFEEHEAVTSDDTLSEWGDATSQHFAEDGSGSDSSFLHLEVAGTFNDGGTSLGSGSSTYTENDSDADSFSAHVEGTFAVPAGAGTAAVTEHESGSAGTDNTFAMEYTAGGAGSYSAGGSAGYGYDGGVTGTESFGVSGFGPGASTSVGATSDTYSVAASGSSTQTESASFASDPGTNASTWGYTVSDSNQFTNVVSGADEGDSGSALATATETGNVSLCQWETDTATASSSDQNGIDTTAGRTTTSQSENDGYTATQISNTSHWLAGEEPQQAGSVAFTEQGTGDSASSQVAVGDETSTDSSGSTVLASAHYAATGADSSSYTYSTSGNGVQGPTATSETQAYQESGTTSYSSTLTLDYSMGGRGSLDQGGSGAYGYSGSATAGDSSTGSGTAADSWDGYSVAASGSSTQTESATFTSDPGTATVQWGYTISDTDQFDNQVEGSDAGAAGSSQSTTTEVGSYSFSSSLTSTSTDQSTVGQAVTQSSSTATNYLADASGYTTTGTDSESHWVSDSATLSQDSAAAVYSATGAATATTIEQQSSSSSDTGTNVQRADQTTFTSSNTDSYAYSGSANSFTSPAVTTAYSADAVTQTIDAGFTWDHAGSTVSPDEVASFTLSEDGGAHVEEDSTPTATASGSLSGSATSYTGLSSSSDGFTYFLALTPGAEATTSVNADYWQQSTQTGSAAYSGDAMSGLLGDASSEHDDGGESASGTYTTSEEGTPAPGGGPGSSYSLFATGHSHLSTARVEDDTWDGASLVHSSAAAAESGGGGDSELLTESNAGNRGWMTALLPRSSGGTVGGLLDGTPGRLVTAADSYTLTATQDYVTDRGTLSGNDSYHLESSDTTQDDQDMSGTAVSDQDPLWAPMPFAGSADVPAATTVTRESSSQVSARTTTDAAFTWANSLPTGASTVRTDEDGAFTSGQTITVSAHGTAVSGSATRVVDQEVVETTDSSDTLTGSGTTVSAYAGGWTPVVTTNALTEQDGADAASINASQSSVYSFVLTGQTPTTVEYASGMTADRSMGETHALTGSVSPAAGTVVATVAAGTSDESWTDTTAQLSASQDSTNTSTLTETSQHSADSVTSGQRAVPPGGTDTLTTAATDAVGFDSDWLSDSASNTSSDGYGSSWRTDDSSVTFTVHDAYDATQLETSSRNEDGTDTHQSHEVGASPGLVVWSSGASDDSTTHTFHLELEEHGRYGSTDTTQDFIDHSDWESVSHTQTSATHGWSDHVEADALHQYTASLTEHGTGTDVSATLNTSETLTLSQDGGGGNPVDGYNTYSSTQTSQDTASRVTSPGAGGQGRTDLASAHHGHSFTTYTHAGGPNPDSSTRATADSDHTVVQSVVGGQTVFLHDVDHPRSEMHSTYGGAPWVDMVSDWVFTTDMTLGPDGTPVQTVDREKIADYYQVWGNFSGGSDDAFLAFVASFSQAFIDVLASTFTLVLANIVLPPPLALLLDGYMFVKGLESMVELGEGLYAALDGRDPETGRTLSNQEVASRLGGVLGSMAGLAVVTALFGGEEEEGTFEDPAVEEERCGEFGACFAAGTPLLTPEGSRAIEEFRPGDLVLSRSEFEPAGPVEPRRVLQTFVRASTIWHLHVGGRVIGTTKEHPFYVLGKGWRAAGELQAGEALLSRDGQWVVVEDLLDTGKVEVVYNIQVADYHTYFVGETAWAVSVWSHNMARECGGRNRELKPEEKMAKIHSEEEDALLDPHDQEFYDENPPAEERYDRERHYPNTPTKTDRKALGAKPGQVVDHDPPLVTRYYEGDSEIGEKPGRSMTQEERDVSKADRSRMRLQDKRASDVQGQELKRYAEEKARELGL